MIMVRFNPLTRANSRTRLDEKKQLMIQILNQYQKEFQDVIKIKIKFIDSPLNSDSTVIEDDDDDNFLNIMPVTEFKINILTKNKLTLEELTQVLDKSFKRIVQNSLLKLKFGKYYLQQTKNYLNTTLTSLFNDNQRKYKQESIFKLLNLQIHLDNDLFRELPYQVRLKVFCLTFVKYVDQVSLSNLIESFCSELDLNIPEKLKTALNRYNVYFYLVDQHTNI